MASPLLLTLTLLLIAAQPMEAFAQSTPTATPEPDSGPRFVLRPADDVDGSYFTLEAEPGSTHTLKVLLGNTDDEPLTLQTYVADVFTLVNGGYGVREADADVSQTAAWVEYRTETLSLASGEGQEREITVSVPDGTEPGQYIAGIVLQTAEPFEVEGAAMFNQIARKSIAVFITVPGNLEASFQLGTPEMATTVVGPKIVIPVQNSGDILVKPEGEITLADQDGNEVFQQPVFMDSVYAGMSTTLEILLPAALPETDYTVSVALSDEATGTTAKSEAASLTLSREVEGPEPLEITTASVAPKPSADDVQFAAVALTVENRELPIEGAQVILSVEKDGKPVEDFVVAQSVTLQQGETTLEQRYIPLDGWSAGEWTFSVTLKSVDPQTGAEAVLLATDVDEPISIGDR